ncbi:MAG TPA: anaerobic ribonucleoside-triphosphate reductase activating protein [Patescibacteria group bacterium]|nr:anaerobic ribonucleoside-triphosphate reductase activating protein [Patescibacteria group bacterium]
MRIGGIVDMSTLDWYGNVSLIIFFAGCNFRCPYCQNSGLLLLDSGNEVNLELIRERIETGMSPVALLDAVVLTGGEPTLQPEACRAISELVKGMGLKVMLDTNGSRPLVTEALLKAEFIDRVALDIKAPLNPEEYSIAAGLRGGAEEIVSNVDATLDLCGAHGVPVEARTTVAPTISDADGFIRRLSRDIRDRCDVYYLQQFDNTGEVLNLEVKALKPPSRERLLELAQIARDSGVENVYIKTRKLGLEKVD